MKYTPCLSPNVQQLYVTMVIIHTAAIVGGALYPIYGQGFIQVSIAMTCLHRSIGPFPATGTGKCILHHIMTGINAVMHMGPHDFKQALLSWMGIIFPSCLFITVSIMEEDVHPTLLRCIVEAYLSHLISHFSILTGISPRTEIKSPRLPWLMHQHPIITLQ